MEAACLALAGLEAIGEWDDCCSRQRLVCGLRRRRSYRNLAFANRREETLGFPGPEHGSRGFACVVTHVDARLFPARDVEETAEKPLGQPNSLGARAVRSESHAGNCASV